MRTLVALAASLGLHLYQDDAPVAFLRGTLKEEIWMEPPPGFTYGSSQMKLRLHKTLYGFKQSPRPGNNAENLSLILRSLISKR